ncbi:Domain of uncharacterised function (DUF2825) [Klebsiella quasipneumoniae]|nr:Domain of uncharacterised function (DUF2825) [Klebsiella quasipneumoniae]
MRGGVSSSAQTSSRPRMSSPRAWGCFLIPVGQLLCGEVFPTCVGVFLSIYEKIAIFWRLPHVRGGVSEDLQAQLYEAEFSPRAWGCFLDALLAVVADAVFPTCVGVFLTRRQLTGRFLCLPHVRGGVSIMMRTEWGASLSSPHAWGARDRLSDADASMRDIMVFNVHQCLRYFV